MATVRDLLMEDGRRWNEGLIRQIFARESAKAILKLQVADDGVADQ